MPPNSEIEKLERRWKENPKGTVFAPYAEVLRKHGDYPMAKDILRVGLEQHPDHIPGNIVLGRCCLDLGEEGPAEAAFVHVLDLDAENVIALKALADITERQGRLMEAASWLSRLISVDPSNDEAREQLTRVAAAREAASAALVAPPVAEPQVAATTEVLAVIQPPTRTVIQPPTPKALEEPETEVPAGGVGGEELTLDADAAVAAAKDAFPAWAATPAAERAAVLHRIADGVEARIEELAQVEVEVEGADQGEHGDKAAQSGGEAVEGAEAHGLFELHAAHLVDDEAAGGDLLDEGGA